MEINKDLNTAIDEAVSHYFDDSIELVEGLDFSQYQTVKKVEYYSSSKYLNGQKDHQGRIKPFYNINNFRVAIAVRATDLDIKNINIEADTPEDSLRALFLNQELYNWMKKTNFSKTLNDLGQARPRYGGVLAKKVEKDGDVHIEAVQWKNIITDQTDILGGITIERHYMSPAEIQQMDDKWENVDKAIELATKTSSTTGDPMANQSNIKQVEVWEVYMDWKDTDGKWKPMQYIIAVGKGREKVQLHSQEKEKPYKYLPWEFVSGRGLGRGVVEDGFEAQMWTNDAVIAQKNAMDLAAKVVITTNSKELEGNALTDIDNGTIIPLHDNGYFNSTQLLPSALPELSNMIDQWDKQFSEVSSSFAAVSGEEMPSGTPFRSLALQARQNAGYFDYKREEFGIFIKEIIEEWVLPQLTKKLRKEHVLVTQLPGEKLNLIDDLMIAAKLEKELKKYIKRNGTPPTREQLEKEQQRLVEFFSQTGNTRYLEIPQGYYDGIKSSISIITTGEQKDKAAVNDRVLGMLEIAAQTGRQDLVDALMKKLLNDSNIGLASEEFATTNVSPTGGNIEQQGEPAVETEIQSQLPEAQQ